MRPVSGAAIQRIGSESMLAPSVWKIRLTLPFCRSNPIWIPRNPKHMFQIWPKLSLGFCILFLPARAIVLFGRAGTIVFFWQPIQQSAG